MPLGDPVLRDEDSHPLALGVAPDDLAQHLFAVPHTRLEAGPTLPKLRAPGQVAPRNGDGGPGTDSLGCLHLVQHRSPECVALTGERTTGRHVNAGRAPRNRRHLPPEGEDRRLNRGCPLSPPVSKDTRISGITGDQGPTR
jgi:hypothetical protein